MKKHNQLLSLLLTGGILLGLLLQSGCSNQVPDTASVIQQTPPTSVIQQTPPASEEAPREPVTAQDPSAEPSLRELRLIMVGDILLHTPVEECALQEDGTYDFHALFSHTKNLIASSDLALVNQEVIIGGESLGISGYPAFNAPYAIGDALADTGFDVVCHATNHALDKGKNGLLNCLSFWQEKHPQIGILGIHDSAESARNLYYYQNGDSTIAILNYTYGTNGIPLPQDMPYSVDLLEQEKVLADIRQAEANADFTIVCPHWGTEYRLTPDASQEKWTTLFLENGVDLVIGTHPHVIEPYEMLTDEATGHSMLVYYSLGNFVNWTSGTGEGVSNRMVGGMADITLWSDADQKVSIKDYGIHALVCHVTSETDGVTVYPLSEYSEALASENEILNQAPDFSYSYCVDLCDQVWGKDHWD